MAYCMKAPCTDSAFAMGLPPEQSSTFPPGHFYSIGQTCSEKNIKIARVCNKYPKGFCYPKKTHSNQMESLGTPQIRHIKKSTYLTVALRVLLLEA